MKLAAEFRQQLLTYQRFEITRHHIYRRLASMIRAPENRQVLERIAQDDLRHYQEWRKYTGQDVKPDAMAIRKYYLISRLFGFTFGIKLMERGEVKARFKYAELRSAIPEIDAWIQDEFAHKRVLVEMLDEERLQYDGSVILGLNDALVELTGVLALLTLALQNTKLIALSGLFTGIAAAMAMSLSEYLFSRSRNIREHPLRAAIYTGVANIFAVTLLIFPYLIFNNFFLDLALALGIAVLFIAIFNFYISVAKDEPFQTRFFEMAGLSLGLAGALSPVGYLIRIFMGIEY